MLTDEQINKKNNKGGLVIMLTGGIFMALVGVMGYSRSSEFVDIMIMISGIALMGASGYRIAVPVTKK